MYQEGGYPIGAKFDRDAPYNQSITEPVEVEVDIVVTMSLRTKIKVNDYDVYEDWDDDEGKVLVKDFDNCNLMKQANEQVLFPTDTEKFKDWTIDDYFVQTVYDTN